MVCQTCSVELQPGQKFCWNCGTPAGVDTTGPQAVVLPPPQSPSPPGPHVPPPAAATVIDPGFIRPNPGQPAAVPTAAIPAAAIPAAAIPAGAGSTGAAEPRIAAAPTLGIPASAYANAAPQAAQPLQTPAWGSPEFDSPTTSFNVVEQTAAPLSPEQWTGGWADTSTAEQPTYQQPAQAYDQPGPSTAATPVYYTPSPPRAIGSGSVALGILAVLSGVATIAGSFLNVLNLSSDVSVRELGDYKINDFILGTNLQVAFVVAGLAVITGGVLAVLGKRFGAGLAGGAGVACVPFVVALWGATQDRIKLGTADAGSSGGSFLQSKLDVGFWLLVIGAGIGLVVLFVAFVQSGYDGRPALHPAICAIGAVAAVIAAAGQMIPLKGTHFTDQFKTDGIDARIVYGRLAILALVAVGGLIGFLRNNRWGVGYALGVATLYIWQWVSSLAKAGSHPAPPSFAGGTLAGKPHAVTTIGVVVLLLVSVAAIVVANQPRRSTTAIQPPPP